MDNITNNIEKRENKLTEMLKNGIILMNDTFETKDKDAVEAYLANVNVDDFVLDLNELMDITINLALEQGKRLNR